MSKIDDMRKRHKKEIQALQNNCQHDEVSGWLLNMWAPGHIDGEVIVCKDCGKVIKKRNERQHKKLKLYKKGE